MHSPGWDTRLHWAHCPFENPLLASSLHYDVSQCWQILGPAVFPLLSFSVFGVAGVDAAVPRAFTYYSRERGTRAATLPAPFTYANIVPPSRTLFSPLSSVSLMDEDTSPVVLAFLYWRAGLFGKLEHWRSAMKFYSYSFFLILITSNKRLSVVYYWL